MLGGAEGMNWRPRWSGSTDHCTGSTGGRRRLWAATASNATVMEAMRWSPNNWSMIAKLRYEEGRHGSRFARATQKGRLEKGLCSRVGKVAPFVTTVSGRSVQGRDEHDGFCGPIGQEGGLSPRRGGSTGARGVTAQGRRRETS